MADITSLPDSVLVYVLSFLRYPILISSSRVCKRWRRLCYDASLWRKLWFYQRHASKVSCEVVRRLVPRKNSYIVSIDLEGCTLIEDEGVKLLSKNCPNLRKLYIKACQQVTDKGIIEIAQNCFKLLSVKLPMENVSSKGLVAVVKNNPHLKRIYAYSRAVTQKTLTAIASTCSDLETLIVYESCLKDHENSSMDVLTDAMLMTLAEGCGKLKEITLRYNQILLSDLSLVCLATKCRMLEQFVVDYCDLDYKITDVGLIALAKFCNISCLHISNGQISDNSLLVIAESVPNIEDLSLEFSKVSDIGIFKLMQQCQKLESLVIHSADNLDRRITDMSAYTIGTYASEDFRLLGIGFADITDKGLKFICENTDLSSLSVSGCSKLTFDGLKSCFDDLSGLMSLDLSFTDIIENDDHLLETGQSLPWLDSIDLTDCFAVSKEGIRIFKEKFPFCKVVT
ncbi:F-box/LRR-repeat protein 7-like [Actinia tenebrosa]|uniref:F-box/LRR-repeat protein 7-like n=1 Tax=Actinia tenebrosa TaxID=6105 RepID=A0A6P8ILS9_ACTTE|nr:F-box/LRR-repeat protein 7-like [Actinia tenebrosa]